MNKEGIPTILYVRQSVTADGSESIPMQIDVCTEAASRFGAEIIDTLVEPPSTSGYKNRGRGRPKFRDLVERIAKGEARAVMAYKQDRLSRGGGPGWAPLIEAFETAGCDIDRAVLTPQGWVSEFELGIRATTDREESRKTSERMLDLRAREARSGKPRVSGRPFAYSCAGKRPDACNVPGCPHDGTISLIPSELVILREAADRVLLGESQWSIVLDFEKRSVPTTRGGGWTTATLSRILSNPRYAGLRSHNGVVVAEGTWEPAFTRDEWERLCVALASRPGAGNRRFGTRTYPLIGYLWCGRCGAKMRSLKKQSGRRAYGCRKGPGLGGCGGLSTVAEPVEQEVKEYVIGKLCDPKYRRQLARLAEQAQDESSSLADQLADIELQRERLLDLYLENKVNKSTYERRYRDLTAAAEDLQSRVFSTPQNTVLRDLPPSLDEVTRLWDERGIGFQRQLIGIVLDRLEVKPLERRQRAFDPGRLVWHPK